MTKEISIGKIKIGNGNPIAIQSMTNVSMHDIDSTVNQINDLAKEGCDIVRVAINDQLCASNLSIVKKQILIPIVADVHFDYRLAISAIENGADKVRINPGNFSKRHLEQLVEVAKNNNVPLRIGVNAGSVSKSALKQSNGNKIEALISSLSEYVNELESLDFTKIVLSAKSSSVLSTIQLARQISKKFGYPIHIGVTEAGPFEQGSIKNAIGIGALLADNVGDTIRVSLTDNPLEEVKVAKQILSSLDMTNSVSFVSCPKCGRCSFDLEHFAKKVYQYTSNINKKMKIAVMGCEVNGPGECADADLGMAGSNGKVAFFKKGHVFAIVPEENALELFFKEIDNVN